MMNCILWFTSADLPIGKIDKSSLSHQTLMELFIADITNQRVIYGIESNIDNISEWYGGFYQVEKFVSWWVRLNDNGDVTDISFAHIGLEGSLALQFLPPTVWVCNVSFNQLTGTADLGNLPQALQTLSLSNNRMSGTLDLEKLPPFPQWINLSYNAFIGTISLENLPPVMEHLDVSHNDLHGPICLQKLPPGISRIYLQENNFFGMTDFANLPDKLVLLNFSNTDLEGTVPHEKRHFCNFLGSKVVIAEA